MSKFIVKLQITLVFESFCSLSDFDFKFIFYLVSRMAISEIHNRFLKLILVKIIFIGFFLFAISSQYTYAQNKIIDSLKAALKSAKHDTTLIKLMIEIGNTEPVYRLGYWDSLRIRCDKAYNQKSNSKLLQNFYGKHYADVLNNLGYVISNEGKVDLAKTYYEKSIILYKETNQTEGLASAYNNLGLVYDFEGNIPKALDYYHQSLKLHEQSKDAKGQILNKEGLAYTLNNIGAIYAQQNEYTKSLDYFLKSKKVREEINDNVGLGESMNNIAYVYDKQGKTKEALTFYLKSLEFKTSFNDMAGVALANNNIGHLYYESGDPFAKSVDSEKSGNEKALFYLNLSLSQYEAIEDKMGIATALINIASVKLRLGELKEAKSLGEKSLSMSKEIGFPSNIQFASKTLSVIYAKLNDFKSAYQMHVLFKQMSDSITNEKNRKLSLQKGFQYEYDKKAIADSLKIADERILTAAQIKQEKTMRFFSLGGLILVLLFSIFIYNRFRVTNKQKKIIEIKEIETQKQNEIIKKQKNIVEEKQKEILDSINYAERIQKSFLATKQHLDSNLNNIVTSSATKTVTSSEVEKSTVSGLDSARPDNYFVFFKPKDVVSGDFYWSSTLNNGLFALATADSTGHGVPGAIMSLLNITSLEKAIETHNEPNEILNATRKIIIERLKKDGSEEGGKDGMDCSLCVYDFNNMQLHFAAANNPVWIVRLKKAVSSSVSNSVTSSEVEKLTAGLDSARPDNSNSTHTHKNSVTSSEVEKSTAGLDSSRPDIEVIEIKPDKMPVGKHDKQDNPFTLQTVALQKGDLIYSLTDGFPDQFGGEKGKKFMSKNLRELLAKNSQLSMAEQKEILEKTFSDWVGMLEQVDDVTVIGVRV
jgi:serine phosphatase RsbU (regulator of sigma subunit)/Tfp pilus assembly protein PilF